MIGVRVRISREWEEPRIERVWKAEFRGMWLYLVRLRKLGAAKYLRVSDWMLRFMVQFIEHCRQLNLHRETDPRFSLLSIATTVTTINVFVSVATVIFIINTSHSKHFNLYFSFAGIYSRHFAYISFLMWANLREFGYFIRRIN